MPNGDGYNPKWCAEKHAEVEKELKKVWGEFGFMAVWKRMDSMEKKLWLIIIALVDNMGGIIVMLIGG